MAEPRPDLLAALPDLIAARIKQSLPDLRTCKAQAGRFDLAALEQMGLAAPAVLVAITGLRQAGSFAGAHHTFTGDFAAFIVTKDALGLPRDTAAAGICQTLLRLIPEQVWGQVGVGAAQKVAAVPLLTAASTKAVSIWAVTWQQDLAFGGYSLAVPQPISIYVGMNGADAAPLLPEGQA